MKYDRHCNNPMVVVTMGIRKEFRNYPSFKIIHFNNHVEILLFQDDPHQAFFTIFHCIKFVYLTYIDRLQQNFLKISKLLVVLICCSLRFGNMTLSIVKISLQFALLCIMRLLSKENLNSVYMSFLILNIQHNLSDFAPQPKHYFQLLVM